MVTNTTTAWDDTRKMATTATSAALPPELRGLSEVDVLARRQRGEGNAVAPATSRSYQRILARNVFTFINILLFGIAIFLVALGMLGDALMTGGLIALNVAVSVIQEGRAKRQLDRIALLVRPLATVIRNGREQTIEPAEIVRGDLLIARPGDQLLVDGVVVRDDGLSVDESLLTGESEAITKHVGDSVYSGTFAISGGALYEARNVGAGSVAQQITGQARQFREIKTPLQTEIGLVIRVMILLVIALGAQVGNSYWHIYRALPLRESVQAAAVLVALVPQGLVFMVTIAYAMAAVRMSGKGALIQRMNAVESSSHVRVLCVDKTGTLTTNTLRLHTVLPLASDLDEAAVRALLGDYAASTVAGNKTNDAIAAVCPGTARPVMASVPFGSKHKWSALAFDDATYLLGAPDILATALPAGAGFVPQAQEWKDAGLRVLLFAIAQANITLRDAAGEPTLPAELRALGLLAFSDELRPEARETIAGFAAANIQLKVISGDHPETVAALARQIGFDTGGKLVSGPELEQMPDAELREAARDTAIFGRITPRQKERLVRALRDQGAYVAMVGDGVNDVLALKQANVAIAMRSGSPMARSVADIVLLNDSFAVLPAAFSEGQRILRGMQDILRLFLTRTAYVALLILATSLMGEPFPVTPKQNGLLALLTVGIPTIGLAAWSAPGASPRRMVRSATAFVVPAAVSITATALTVYLLFMSLSNDVELARAALTTTTVFCGLLLIPFVAPPSDAFSGGDLWSGDRRPTCLALAMLALFFLILEWPFLRNFYELKPLPWSGYLLIALAVIGWATCLRFWWRLKIIERVQAWGKGRLRDRSTIAA